jgi:linoleate 10R-lipoxygenase
VTINETSSYVDLAPLYGNNKEALGKINVHDGRGLLHPDTFAEDRLLLLPPAVGTLLVLFNRNHNVRFWLSDDVSLVIHRHVQYIAQKLLEINERGTYKKPEDVPVNEPNRAKQLAQQEEDIFRTARLIKCSWFGSAIFSDYFSSILGLHRQGSTWSLNPFDVCDPFLVIPHHFS